MKSPVLFGASFALTDLALKLIFFGPVFHPSPTNLPSVQLTVFCCDLLALIMFVVFGIRTARAAVPTDHEFSGTAACTAGLATALTAAGCVLVLNYLYFKYINPGFGPLFAETTLRRMAAHPITHQQLVDEVAKLRDLIRPRKQAIFNGIEIGIGGVCTSIIASAFLRRQVPAK